MNALRLFLALVIVLLTPQCAKADQLPPHFFVYELVLKVDRQRIETGSAYRTRAACEASAAEQNIHTSGTVRFACEPLIVLKEHT